MDCHRQNIYAEFQRIMQEEKHIFKYRWPEIEAEYIYNIASQILENCKNSFVLQEYNRLFGMTEGSCAYESRSARTNLVSEIVDQYFGYYCGQETDSIESFGHSYRAIMKAIRWHNLPDLPNKYSLDYEYRIEKSAENLLGEMREHETLIGQILYCADEVSNPIAFLCCDKEGAYPKMKRNSHNATPNDRELMKLCDNKSSGYCKASEMRTVDFLRKQKVPQYDKNGFFTALLVMTTLIVNGRWYNWREKDYEDYCLTII